MITAGSPYSAPDGDLNQDGTVDALDVQCAVLVFAYVESSQPVLADQCDTDDNCQGLFGDTPYCRVGLNAHKVCLPFCLATSVDLGVANSTPCLDSGQDDANCLGTTARRNGDMNCDGKYGNEDLLFLVAIAMTKTGAADSPDTDGDKRLNFCDLDSDDDEILDADDCNALDDTIGLCNDGKVCTTDACINAACSYDPVADATPTGLCRQCDGAGSEKVPADDNACGTIDCDEKDIYFTDGEASATGTNYCKLRDYDDLSTSRCKSLGTCKTANSADCAEYDEQTVASCGTCKFATGACSSCSNYPDATDCGGGGLECNGSGSCVQYTFEWYSGDWTVCAGAGYCGTQTREVYCKRNDGAVASNEKCGWGKPIASSSCATSCPSGWTLTVNPPAYAGRPCCKKNLGNVRYNGYRVDHGGATRAYFCAPKIAALPDEFTNKDCNSASCAGPKWVTLPGYQPYASYSNFTKAWSYPWGTDRPVWADPAYCVAYCW